jgi:hypothetical protein
VISLKKTLGDKTVEFNEDKVENSLNIQENNTLSSQTIQPSSDKSKESGP